MQASAGRSWKLRSAIRSALLLACCAPAVVLATDAAAVAAADTATDASVPADTAGLQEVTVTATRREQSLSKVPISITAMTAADMEDRGIKDIADLARFTPGITVDADGTN